MRNVFLFIRRYFTFITFIVLQVAALFMINRFNKFHRAVLGGKANEITGFINSKMDKVNDFIGQGEENRRLHKMNDSLLNQLKDNFIKQDSSARLVTDTVLYDTSAPLRKYIYRDAKVVYNSVRFDKNLIQLDRGANQGIKDNMIVLSSDGSFVGRVVNVSANFSAVMSLLHTDMKLNGKLKRTDEFGTVTWNAKDPRYVTLMGIPKSVQVKAGDTILTSTYTFDVPPGRMIGTVTEIVKDNSSNFYNLKVKTSADFYKLQYVHVVENLFHDEQQKLDADTKRKLEGKLVKPQTP
jgi:rod shape-determining protein MreC